MIGDMDCEQLRREDDRLIGELMANVKILSREVSALRGQVDLINERMNTGRGMFYGAMFAAGGLGAGLSQLIERIFK